jgi:hypothetical protein
VSALLRDRQGWRDAAVASPGSDYGRGYGVLAGYRHARDPARGGVGLLLRPVAADFGPAGGCCARYPLHRACADCRSLACTGAGAGEYLAGVQPWGGRCLYRHPVCGQRATHVSFDRPYGWDSAAQDPLHWELPLVHFLERNSVDVSYQTDLDTNTDVGSLLRHRLVVVAGHSEYWTKTMFDGFDTARDAGTNLAFMGANAVYWQIRYTADGRTIIAYKNSPDPEPDPALQTIRFSELKPPRYECELTGVQHLGGSFTHKVDDYTVNADALNDPWFGNSGFTAGSVVRQIVSGERDDLPPGQEPGHACGHPMAILFQHLDSQTKALDAAKAIRYTASSGARVFASGSHEFAYGLDPLSHPELTDPRLQRFMLNALDDLERPAPPKAQLILHTYGTVIVVTPPSDPRILGFQVTRHDPTKTTLLTSCHHNGCFDRTKRGPHTHYETVVYDRWTRSQPTTATR